MFSSVTDWLWVLIRGFFMGAADLIPGISGGTVALISGLYERLIEALRQLRWGFLLTVALGIVIAVLPLARLIHALLNQMPHVSYLYAMFFGLVLGSVYFLCRRIKRWSVIALVLGAIAGYGLSVVGELDVGERYNVPFFIPNVPHLEKAANYDLAREEFTGITRDQLAALQVQGEVQSDTIVYSVDEKRSGEAQEFAPAHLATGFRLSVLGAGVVSACALLLPGVSGAYLLNVLGFYTDFIANVALLASGHWEGSAALFVITLAVGIVIGLLLFAHLIGWLLKRFPNATLAALVGLMIGALRAVWPFWSTLQVLDPLRIDSGLQLKLIEPIWPDVSTGPFWFALLWLAGGFVVLFFLERIAHERT